MVCMYIYRWRKNRIKTYTVDTYRLVEKPLATATLSVQAAEQVAGTDEGFGMKVARRRVGGRFSAGEGSLGLVIPPRGRVSV